MANAPARLTDVTATAAQQADPLAAFSASRTPAPRPRALPRAAGQGGKNEDRKALGLRVRRDTWTALRRLAADEGTTVQELGLEALNLLFRNRRSNHTAD